MEIFGSSSTPLALQAFANECTNKPTMIMISSILKHTSSREHDMTFPQTLYGLLEFNGMPTLTIEKRSIQ